MAISRRLDNGEGAMNSEQENQRGRGVRSRKEEAFEGAMNS